MRLKTAAGDVRKRIAQAEELRNKLVSDIIAVGGVADGRRHA